MLRRVTILIGVALLLGLLTSVGVAWWFGAVPAPKRGLAAYGAKYKLHHFSRRRVPERGEGVGHVDLHLFQSTGVTVVEASARAETFAVADDSPTPESAAPAWARKCCLPWRSGDAPWPEEGWWDHRVARATGWPMRAMRHGYEWKPDAPGSAPTPAQGEYVTPGGIRTEPSVGMPGAWPITYPKALPLRPIWRGLIVDSAVYALAWGAMPGLFLCGRGVVRARRGRGGRCATCGYSRRGLSAGSACPECGSVEGAGDSASSPASRTTS